MKDKIGYDIVDFLLFFFHIKNILICNFDIFKRKKQKKTQKFNFDNLKIAISLKNLKKKAEKENHHKILSSY